MATVVRPVEEYSTRARPRWTEDVDLVYIDGKHDVWTFSDDLRWRAFLPPGASVLVHDAFSSIGVTLGILLRVLPASDLAYVGRAGSMALFQRRRPSLADRLRIVARAALVAAQRRPEGPAAAPAASAGPAARARLALRPLLT